MSWLCYYYISTTTASDWLVLLWLTVGERVLPSFPPSPVCALALQSVDCCGIVRRQTRDLTMTAQTLFGWASQINRSYTKCSRLVNKTLKRKVKFTHQSCGSRNAVRTRHPGEHNQTRTWCGPRGQRRWWLGERCCCSASPEVQPSPSSHLESQWSHTWGKEATDSWLVKLIMWPVLLGYLFFSSGSNAWLICFFCFVLNFVFLIPLKVGLVVISPYILTSKLILSHWQKKTRRKTEANTFFCLQKSRLAKTHNLEAFWTNCFKGKRILNNAYLNMTWDYLWPSATSCLPVKKAHSLLVTSKTKDGIQLSHGTASFRPRSDISSHTTPLSNSQLGLVGR